MVSFFLVIFGYFWLFWLFLVIFGYFRMGNVNDGVFCLLQCSRSKSDEANGSRKSWKTSCTTSENTHGLTFAVAVTSIVFLLAARHAKRRFKSIKMLPEALVLVSFFFMFTFVWAT
jgi:hypothetical protein